MLAQNTVDCVVTDTYLLQKSAMINSWNGGEDKVMRHHRHDV